VSVLDHQGLPITGLGAANFRVKVDGRPATVVAVHRVHAGTRIVLMLDESASMAPVERGPGGFAELLARDFLTREWDGNQIAFLSFGTHVYAEADFSATLGGIAELLAPPTNPKLPIAHGTTSLWDAMSRAAALFGKTRPGDAIYLITDGEANSGKESQYQLSDQMVGKGIRVFAFLATATYLLPGVWRTGPGPGSLFSLAKRTGGGEPEFPFSPREVLSVNRPPEYAGEAWNAFWKYGRFSMLRPALDALYSRITDYYGVEVFRSGKAARKAKVKLWIADPQGARVRHIEVDYPHQIAACSPANSN
jgi:hypothetical protein